jgi:Ca2+:H+ antiporter
MPNFTVSSDGPTFSYIQEVFLIVMCLGLYAVFLGIQTGRHRGYFSQPGSDHHSSSGHKHKHDRSALTSAALMLAHLVPVVFLVEQLAVVLNYGLDEMHAPAPLGGLAVAILVLFPEGLAAVRAAVANHVQRSINILLGSVLATLALTAPAVVILSLLRGAPVVLGVQGPNQPLLALTLALAVVTFSSGKTNVLQGVVHLMLFLAYLMLLFWG